MVRSNFDYTNRPSSGERLGASIASDFWKKAAQPAKTIKASSTAPRVQARLDIRIPDKALTDVGMLLVAEALVAALTARPDLSLTDLDLSGNELTIRSIPGIAQIVANAPDLHTLNLANNTITVVSSDDGHDFTGFARACWACANIRRLDLSHNDAIGNLAMEVLARALIHTAQCKEADTDVHDRHTPAIEAPISVTADPHGSPKKGSHAQQRLPSVDDSPPTIHQGAGGCVLTLKDVGLDDEGALFLCSIILTMAHRGMPITTCLDGNTKTLTKDGSHLIGLTDRHVASANLPTDVESSASGADDEYFDAEDGPTAASPNKLGRPRRTSINVPAVDTQDVAAEMERCRKKVQRNAIVKHSYTCCELWTAAMDIFRASRKLYLLAPPSKQSGRTGHKTPSKPLDPHAVTPLLRKLDMNRQGSQGSVYGSAHDSPMSGTPFQPSTPTTSGRASLQGKPAKHAIAGADIDFGPLATRPVSLNKQAKLKRRQKRAENQRPSSSEASDAHDTPAERKATPSGGRYRAWQEKRTHDLQRAQGGASDGFRDTSLRCQLPLDVGLRVLQHVVDARALDLLSERQRRKAFEWAQLHDSLGTEYDWRNRDKASQVWMLLEALECLEYE